MELYFVIKKSMKKKSISIEKKDEIIRIEL